MEENKPVENGQNIQQLISPAPKSTNFLLIGLIIIFIAVFTSAGTFLFMSQKQKVAEVTPSPKIEISPAPTTDQTANWKTYTSKFGYMFKYPPTWATEESVGDQGAMIWSKPEYIQLSQQQREGFTKDDYATIEVGMYIKGSKVADNSDPTGKGLQTVNESTNPKDFATKLYGSMLLSSEDILLDGKPAVEFTVKRMVLKPGLSQYTQNCPPELEPCLIQNGTTKQVWTMSNGNILFIQYQYYKNYTGVNKLDSNFNLLLSTFKFTNETSNVNPTGSTDISTWKTYNATNFTVIYPADWTTKTDSGILEIYDPNSIQNQTTNGGGTTKIASKFIDIQVINSTQTVKEYVDKAITGPQYNGVEIKRRTLYINGLPAEIYNNAGEGQRGDIAVISNGKELAIINTDFNVDTKAGYILSTFKFTQ